MTQEARLSVFLSYNSTDKDCVRKLAAAIAVTGVHVWFDEWKIRPGDSIPGAIDQGIAGFNLFVLVWSDAASRSRWVKTEMTAAITRWVSNDALRVVPVVLDKTPLPALLASLRYIDGTDRDQLRITRELLGLESEAAFRRAVQAFIDEAGLEFREFWGVGVLVACPQCGATPDKLKACESIDEHRDDRYVGATCTICGWAAGSEV
jgi:hypothetical protein